MANETDVNFDYIPRLRYIVEIKDMRWTHPVFSKRLCAKSTAKTLKDSYNALIGFTARIHDTKTGEVA